jgi:uncharacterized repeat protein (TIGR03803 family)
MKELSLAKAVCSMAAFCIIVVIAAPSQTFQTLATFNGANGSQPAGPLIQGSDGNFYGTTFTGGTAGLGTVFQITPQGTLTTLYNFGTAASYPGNGLVLGNDGLFYGTAEEGAMGNEGGSVFTITPSGALTTLYDFTCTSTGCPDGAGAGALVQGTDGNFYGTTGLGGANNSGTFFSITAAGQFTKLYDFCSGCYSGPLIQGSDGNFYGTSVFGGQFGEGMVYQITPAGVLTELYSFCLGQGCVNGWNPYAGLVQGTDGNFYGSTSAGGLHNAGTVFRITPSGQLTTLYNFCSVMEKGFCADGSRPTNALIQATDGNFYGVTEEGGTGTFGACLHSKAGCGTIFRLTPSGVLTTLYNFCSASACADGSLPDDGNALLEASDGTFYGTTPSSGFSGVDGVVFSFSLNVALAPTFSPASLSFGNRAVDSSTTRSVTIKNVNTGSAVLDLTGITFTGSTDFSISKNTCGTTLAAGKICSISVTYAASVLGTESATLSVADNAPASPQSFAISGTGVLQAMLTPSILTFTKTKVGNTSLAKTFKLKNNLSTTLTGISYSTTGPFSVSTTTCGTTLNSNASCTLSVTFSPTATGAATGTLNVSDSANNSPQTATLSGTGD